MSRVSLKDDACSYEEKLSRSIGPGMYMLSTPANDCDECGKDIPADPSIRWQAYGSTFCTPGKVVDTGSELLGLNYKKTKCAANEYNPNTFVNKNPVCHASGTQNSRKCTAPQESSRLSNPPCTLRATGWNRWEWLCENPQERATIPFEHGTSIRTLVKDNFVPCLPAPKDHTNELKASPANPLETLCNWSPPAGCGADGPGDGTTESLYRSCQWARAVGN